MADRTAPETLSKPLLRQQGHAARATVRRSFPDAPLHARDIFLKAIPLSARDIVALTLPIGDEMDTRPLCAALASQGIPLALPVVARKGQPLLFRHFDPGQACGAGLLGNDEPPPEAPLVRPTLLVVPFLAFDRQGHRLGRGGGYYDRTLAALRRETGSIRAIGYGYAAQEVLRLPAESHDEPMDDVITEGEWIRCLRRN